MISIAWYVSARLAYKSNSSLVKNVAGRKYSWTHFVAPERVWLPSNAQATSSSFSGMSRSRKARRSASNSLDAMSLCVRALRRMREFGKGREVMLMFGCQNCEVGQEREVAELIGPTWCLTPATFFAHIVQLRHSSTNINPHNTSTNNSYHQ